MIFQIFGSASSQDYDVMVFVDEIPDTYNATQLCLKNNKILEEIFKNAGFSEKELNSNLAIIGNDTLKSVFKGTIDECANALIDTYHLHHQFYPQQITKRIERDIELKALRCARVILSFISRSEHREIVKKALKSDFNQKLETLSKIDISKIENFGEKNFSRTDIYKTIAFQLGQTIGLFDNKELYTKEDIVKEYPFITEHIYRNPNSDLTVINSFKDYFIRKCLEKEIKMQIEPAK